VFIRLFFALREGAVPVSLKEFLTFLEAMRAEVAGYDVEAFYYLARASLVKDERHMDRFDRVFAGWFEGMARIEDPFQRIPDAWLEKLAEKHLTEEERAQVQAMGGWRELLDTLRKRLEEQQERHQGGSKWVGTAGTSPFGAYGYNPMGVRIGQNKSRHRRAVKVWDERAFADFADDREFGTRDFKVALRGLRRFTREGRPDEFDLPGTIRATARNAGWLDIKMRAERKNRIKLLLFLDVGGSMDDHVELVEQLFSAARSEFQHLEHVYFHNCLYERVWKDNRRRYEETTPTRELLRTYGPDTRVLFVGDASMSPYEISEPGGSVEHWNEEAGEVWLRRVLKTWERVVWINPVPERAWRYTWSIGMLKGLLGGRMVPLTVAGLEDAIRLLKA